MLHWDQFKVGLQQVNFQNLHGRLCQEGASPISARNAPSKYNIPQYGAKQQLTKIDTSAPRSKVQQKLLMQVSGKFLYYARFINDIMMHALNNLATTVNDGTQATVEAITYFLNYCASNLNITKLYQTRDMILTTYSDVAYLVAPKARSRANGFHYLGNKDKRLLNGSITIIAKNIKAVMSSAAEAEVRALYINAINL